MDQGRVDVLLRRNARPGGFVVSPEVRGVIGFRKGGLGGEEKVGMGHAREG